MSIFQIKSLQSLRAAKKADPVADLKDTGHEKVSRTPIYVGASIAALVMYMKAAHAEAAAEGHGPLPLQDNGEHEQPQLPDAEVSRSAARATGTSSPRDLPAGPDFSADDPAVGSLGEWGWEIAGTTKLQLHFGSSASVSMPGVQLLGVFANDNGGRSGNNGGAKVKAGNARTGALNAVSNRAPTASGPVLLDGGFSAMAVLFTLDDLLKGAVDPDKDALDVINVEASSGVIIPVEDGYMYIGDAVGPVTLTYAITDGQTTIPQQASFTVSEHAATLGTNASDNIVGADGGELIQSGLGNDTILGGAAIDTIYGDDGNDEIHGGAGNDVIVGGAGNDRLFGDAGNDVIFAGTGNDEVHGGDGSDRAFGGAGNDLIFGEAGNDALFGEAGNDTLKDGAGQDYVDGGEGSDTVVASADREADSFDGGAGADTLSYAESQRGVVIDIAGEEAKGSDIGTDTVRNFERFVGGHGNDTFVTGDRSVTLHGGEGDDVFAITVAGIDAADPVRHVIEDFEVGDHVRMSQYDIFDDAPAVADFLDQMNASARGEAPDSAVPIQFRFDEASHRTFIEADFDRDGTYEASVEIEGHHDLQLHHNSFA